MEGAQVDWIRSEEGEIAEVEGSATKCKSIFWTRGSPSPKHGTDKAESRQLHLV